jgi:hypothetical protein
VSWLATRAGLLLAALVAVIAPTDARGQGLSLDISAGRVVYDPVSTNLGTNNVMGTLRYDTRRGVWVYGTAATPLRGGDPVWGRAVARTLVLTLVHTGSCSAMPSSIRLGEAPPSRLCPL